MHAVRARAFVFSRCPSGEPRCDTHRRVSRDLSASWLHAGIGRTISRYHCQATYAWLVHGSRDSCHCFVRCLAHRPARQLDLWPIAAYPAYFSNACCWYPSSRSCACCLWRTCSRACGRVGDLRNGGLYRFAKSCNRRGVRVAQSSLKPAHGFRSARSLSYARFSMGHHEADIQNVSDGSKRASTSRLKAALIVTPATCRPVSRPRPRPSWSGPRSRLPPGWRRAAG